MLVTNYKLFTSRQELLQHLRSLLPAGSKRGDLATVLQKVNRVSLGGMKEYAVAPTSEPNGGFKLFEVPLHQEIIYSVAEASNGGVDSISLYKSEESALKALSEEYSERVLPRERTFRHLDEACEVLSAETDSYFFWSVGLPW